MRNDNHRVYWECGQGWAKLIRPLVERCTELGGSIEQVKEKYGRLRFYYYPGDPGTEQQWAAFEDAVNQACDESGRVCEMCGERGKMMHSSYWLKCLCKDHSLELGYRDRA